MELIFDNLDDRVREMLSTALSAHIAVAYFRPDSETLRILKAIPDIKITVSNEFDKNDPYKIEEITSRKKSHSARCIAVFPNRLHAKVFYGKDKDGNTFAFIGSANLTTDGLSRNREASVAFYSKIEEDQPALRDISTWLDILYQNSYDIDIIEAKKIFDNRTQSPIEHRTGGGTESRVWTIKTRDGQDQNANDYWNNFLAEEVIALGWGTGLRIDPSTITKSRLAQLIQNRFSTKPTKTGRIANEILQFSGQQDGIQINDIVWIIGSFTPNQNHPVNIYGVARVTGSFQVDSPSSWWKFKRSAKILPIVRTLDIEIVRQCFVKPDGTGEPFGAMSETLYQVHSDSSQNLCRAIHRQYGISVAL